MHREILGLKRGDPRTGDHKDRRRTLDNTDNNLRVASRLQQMYNIGKSRSNKSGYKGVHFHRQSGKWRAQISVAGKIKSLGLFDTPELAYVAYCKAADMYHAEYACVG
jgi:hypothetical protein